MFNKTKLLLILLSCGLFVIASTANAGYKIKLGDNSTIEFGGFIKADARYVNGDVNAVMNDYWTGNGNVGSISRTKLSANETRFNIKYVNGDVDVTGFIEVDFYGIGGTEVISNSSPLRLRHAFIQYKNLLAGQAWTTFMNPSALAEAVDFGGPLAGSSFIRQGQLRYTLEGLQVALENPESDQGDANQDSIPDAIAKYTLKGDWGNVSVSGLYRRLNTDGGQSKSAFGYGIAGRVKTFGKDDLRFQFHGGETGRYVSALAARDLVGEQVEESISVLLAYRHFWSADIRSNAFYGNTKTEVTDADRTHWGVNIFKNYTPKLSFGLEIGNFEMAEQNVDADYVQLAVKYVL